jgi:hypothetical protein
MSRTREHQFTWNKPVLLGEEKWHESNRGTIRDIEGERGGKSGSEDDGK